MDDLTPTTFAQILSSHGIEDEGDHSDKVCSEFLEKPEPTAADYALFYPKYYMIRLIVLSWKKAPQFQKWLRLELEQRSTLERKPLTELHRFLTQEMEGEAVSLLKIDKPTTEWRTSDWAEEGPVQVGDEVWWGRVPKNEWTFPTWVLAGAAQAGKGLELTGKTKEVWEAFGIEPEWLRIEWVFIR